jgi:NAD(P)-dependent dehydrogenase (short-subunit alcohol dehydrogenase family)
MRLKDKITLITGGNSGIGRATAKRFVEEGAYVCLTGRNQTTIDETIAELGPDRASGFPADAGNPVEMQRVLEAVRAKHGRLDVLFLNAGVTGMTPIGSTTEEAFDKLFAINVKGIFFTVQAAVPLFPASGGSIIINSSTLNAKGAPAMSVYAASKAAVRSFARSFSAELKPQSIRVNCVSPGPIETPIYGRLGVSKEQLEAMTANIRRVTPAGRFGQAVEVADCVVFLASDESRYVLGADFAVDGGFAQI